MKLAFVVDGLDDSGGLRGNEGEPMDREGTVGTVRMVVWGLGEGTVQLTTPATKTDTYVTLHIEKLIQIQTYF